MEKSILITGCSSGIGLASAKLLHTKGYRVFATVRKEADLEQLEALGLEGILLDMKDPKSIENAVSTVLAKTNGHLFALFNNAGYAETGAVEDLTREMLSAQFETNVFGTMQLTNLILPIMRKQGFGRIVMNTSILGIVAMPFRGAYCASKFALEGITQSLRQEIHGSGIYVSIIAPGPIHSELRKNALVHYENNLATKESIHRDTYDKMQKYFYRLTASENRFAESADAVAKKLLYILESNKPRAHYYVTFSAHLFALLRRLLPDRALDFLMEKINRGELGAK